MTPKTLTVTLGEEHFSIERFNGFRVGPISLTVEVNPGESVEVCLNEALAVLTAMSDRIFIERRNKFHEHLKAKQ